MKAGRRGRSGEPPRRRRAGKRLPYRICHYDHKRTWTSRKLANDALEAMLRAPDAPERAYVYWCVKAGGWHVSTRAQGEFDRRQVISNRRGGMTDHAIEATVKAIAEHGIPEWTKTLEPIEVKMECPCGKPIEVKLGGVVRELAPGPHDPAAELITLTLELEHFADHHGHAVSMYVVKREPE